MRWNNYASVPVMALLLLLQASVLPHLPVLGLTPQLLLLVVISWTLLRGLETGFVWAFVAGMFLDLFAISPLGSTALTLMAVVLVVVGIQKALPPNMFFVPVLTGAAGTFVYLLLHLSLLRLLGFELPWTEAAALAPLIVLHGLLILPIFWIGYRLDRLANPRRVQI